MRRTTAGVLGGTFDPPHAGHLEIAELARSTLGLERVLMLPCAIPPHKDRPRVTPVARRLEMLRLAVAGREWLEISTLESSTGKVCFTIDTLRRMRLPPIELDPVFLMGMDSLIDLPTWHGFTALLREFDLAVVDRRDPVTVLDRLHREVVDRIVPGAAASDDLGAGGRVFHIRLSPPPISSREIRRRVRAGGSAAGLVPPAVAGYIQANRLYRQEDGR